MSTSQIQIHRLEGFYWVARTGGYARAARAFPYPITQPAVHQQVKKLETELGVHLFERVGKDRMQPTPAGERLYRFVRPFYDALPSLLRALREGDYGGELRIAATGLFLRSLLPDWLHRLRKANPRLQVHVAEALVPDLAPLMQGEVDLIVDHIPDVPAQIATLEVGRMRPFVVLPRKHPLATRKKLRLASFAAEPFVAYPPGTLAHGLQMQALGRHGVKPPNVVSGSSAEVIMGFVAAGLGYSLLPSLEPDGPKARGLRVLPLESPKVEFPVYAAWRKDTPENPFLDAMLETAPGG